MHGVHNDKPTNKSQITATWSDQRLPHHHLAAAAYSLCSITQQGGGREGGGRSNTVSHVRRFMLIIDCTGQEEELCHNKTDHLPIMAVLP